MKGTDAWSHFLRKLWKVRGIKFIAEPAFAYLVSTKYIVTRSIFSSTFQLSRYFISQERQHSDSMWWRLLPQKFDNTCILHVCYNTTSQWIQLTKIGTCNKLLVITSTTFFKMSFCITSQKEHWKVYGRYC